MAALVGYTQNVYNAEGVMRDSEAVVFDYKVLQDVNIRHRRDCCAWKLEATNLRIGSIEDLHLSPEIHLLDLLE